MLLAPEPREVGGERVDELLRVRARALGLEEVEILREAAKLHRANDLAQARDDERALGVGQRNARDVVESRANSLELAFAQRELTGFYHAPLPACPAVLPAASGLATPCLQSKKPAYRAD